VSAMGAGMEALQYALNCLEQAALATSRPPPRSKCSLPLQHELRRFLPRRLICKSMCTRLGVGGRTLCWLIRDTK
jgi:hypothetical protein